MWTTEENRVRKRHAEYMDQRMQVVISDEQYLWWDWIFQHRFDKALSKYRDILEDRAQLTEMGCLVTPLGDRPRMRFEKRDLLMYRFTYAIATVLPLSSIELIRHECNNGSCVNPRHLMVGDHRENFDDFVAEQAYGTRWDLLRKWKDTNLRE